ncbi:MAG: alpha/beta hydrolase [Alphaproteobacteria bacterium]|nr:alpha/beta hydrolase [Alphaproteobacteria bacterium]MBL6936592.1 alpha/beta hydrolase [Alphaproteobacteria bacterium]MBL7098357.1 alpha/beta hydrolase [Alphaproteobacteria bacterium]
MAEEEFRFGGADGTSIFCYRWLPERPVRGVLQISHGMGEHALRYREPLQPLIESGIAIYANDHRGHGRTSPDSLGDFGFGGFAALVDDMAALSRLIRDENPGKKIVLMGHSMGSFAAQIYVADHSGLIDGYVLSGSAAIDKLQAPSGGLSSIGGVENPRTPFDWLSRDDKEVDKYIADPLCGFTVNDAGRASMFAAAPAALDMDRLRKIRSTLPVYVFAGDKDPINADLTRLHPLMDRYREAGLTDITTDYYAGGRHEMLNETNRAEVVRNLQSWIDRVVA